MSIYTFVVDFGENFPLITKHTNILGGTLNAVQFSDALAELERVTKQRDELMVALQWFIENDDTNDTPSNWFWLEGLARGKAAIAKATESPV